MQHGGGILVVGADGMIGAALAERFVNEGRRVVGTTHKGGPNSATFDLERDAATWPIPPNIAVAYLCAAVTSTEDCRVRPDIARTLNVNRTVTLAYRLMHAGARVVFPSTNMVFDGSVPFQHAEAATCPKTAYGRMKAEAEEQMIALGDHACIVRLTKVIGPRMPLLVRWRELLERQEPVHPFSDMVVAPISLAHAIDALMHVGLGNSCGVFQASSTEDSTYHEVALRLAERLGANKKLIRPVSAAESLGRFEHLPRYTTLDTTRLRVEFGLVATDVMNSLEYAA